MKHLFLKLLSCFFTFSAHGSQGLPRGWNLISQKDLKLKTIDGDTFEADLNQNGRITGKQERVRLLYVDTPELNQSHKGKDLQYGIPAKDFLKQKLNTGRCFFWWIRKIPGGIADGSWDWSNAQESTSTWN